jgi:hypothetical protein
MTEKSQNKRRVKFKYIFSDDYNPTYANGARGGITPNGDLIINFYFERPPILNSEVYDVKEDGSLGNIVEKDPDDKESFVYVRFINNGIILKLNEAKAIYEWFGKQIETLEKLLKRKEVKGKRKL